MNARCQALLSVEPAEAMGKPLSEVLQAPLPDLARLEKTLALPPNMRTRVLLALEARDGSRRSLEVDAKNDPRDEHHVLLFTYDVTEVTELRSATIHLTAGRMIGSSPAMLGVLMEIQDLSQGTWTVLIEGETGTGKELVARALHGTGPRAAQRFVAVNCAGLSESLLSSQLFGHRRGSFTGAVADQEGLFEAAHGGTLFLDEVGEIPLALQAHLLRVLQEREIARLGDTRPRKVDVRILAATHRDLESDVASGRFRQDLFYRLRVARIRVPPLRDRREDIPLLAEAFLSEARATTGKPIRRVDRRALEVLASHDWPGNIREMRSCIEQAVIRCRGDILGPEDLPAELLRGPGVGPSAAAFPVPVPPAELDLGPILEGDERERYVTALRKARGNRKRAAQLLGVSRATFYRRIAALGLRLGRGGRGAPNA